MSERFGVITIIIVALVLAMCPVAAAAPNGDSGGGSISINASTGATPNYRTLLSPDLMGMPRSDGAEYVIRDGTGDDATETRGWYRGVPLDYLMNVEIGMRPTASNLVFRGADSATSYANLGLPMLDPAYYIDDVPPILAYEKSDDDGATWAPLGEEEGPFKLVITKYAANPDSQNSTKIIPRVRAIEVEPMFTGVLNLEATVVPTNELLVSGAIFNRTTFTIDRLKSIREYQGDYDWLVGSEEREYSATGMPLDYLLSEVCSILPDTSSITVRGLGGQKNFPLEEVFDDSDTDLPWLIAWGLEQNTEPGMSADGGPLETLSMIRPKVIGFDENGLDWIGDTRVIQAVSGSPHLNIDNDLQASSVPEDRMIVCGRSNPWNVPDYWYLAEGYTGGGFEEYVCVANPNSWTTRVNITCMIEGEEPLLVPPVYLDARSRYTVNIGSVVGPDKNVSVQVEGYHGDSVTVERSMYWNNRGGGHASAAVSSPSTEWNLAEGCTANGFETWVLLQNPGSAAATATVTYMTADGSEEPFNVEVPANSRKTIDVSEALPNNEQVSATIISDRPVIAERAMYWNNRQAGTCASGLTRTGTEWYLAEGCTGPGYETWVLLQNPGEGETTVGLTFMDESGTTEGPELSLGGGARMSVRLSDYMPGNWAVSTRVASDDPIAVERAMYWSDNAGGHAETAVEAPKLRAFLAEGCTAGGFESYILLQNPGKYDADVYITYLTSEGAIERDLLNVPAGKRVNVYLADDVGAQWEVSAQVNSTVPIVVEHAIYWNGTSADGSCSHGYQSW